MKVGNCISSAHASVAMNCISISLAQVHCPPNYQTLSKCNLPWALSGTIYKKFSLLKEIYLGEMNPERSQKILPGAIGPNADSPALAHSTVSELKKKSNRDNWALFL